MRTDGGDEGGGEKMASVDVHLAVGELADAVGPDTYREEYIAAAVEHLEAALATAPEGSAAADRITRALEYLPTSPPPDVPADGEKMAEAATRLELDERRGYIREALAELAPVAARVTDPDLAAASRIPLEVTPTVPVFYPVPRRAADRAIERFRAAVERGDGPDRKVALHDYIYEEVSEFPVIYVDGEPLGEYAGRAGLDRLAIEPDDDSDAKTDAVADEESGEGGTETARGGDTEE